MIPMILIIKNEIKKTKCALGKMVFVILIYFIKKSYTEEFKYIS